MTAEERRRKYAARVLAEMEDAGEADPRHGTILGYTVGCRCLTCTYARRKYMQDWRDRRAGLL